MKMDFINYFNDVYEYPDPTSTPLLVDSIGSGILFEYISETFLLAYINYVEIIRAYGINRYTNPNEKDINSIYNDHGDISLHKWEDDFLILAKCLNKENSYFYFWFDRDVSDCCIGNFISDDPIEDIVENFDVHVKETNYDQINSYTRDNGYDGNPSPLYDPVLLKKIIGWVTA